MSNDVSVQGNPSCWRPCTDPKFPHRHSPASLKKVRCR
ncbi:hypothetical protein AG1IA_10018 [Rhizoctonia solani AG-1 IA]|uniref:Uncharacterized protein n=1 Tax=Thanatephorus cucumeris (strain AG1-IA) TaxID=983506 RepID=L8WGV1_THACA|nr:hypothetical protein AG1IA_10018 [Rhizoctonia solani AG-1 IA]